MAGYGKPYKLEKLPKGYTEVVKNKLEKQGITANRQQIYDAVRGKIKSSELTLKILLEVEIIRKNHRRMLRKIGRLNSKK